VRWVRRFLTRPASNEQLADQVQRFCEELEQQGTYADWQIHQAEQALRIYFVNFLHRTDWHRPPQSTIVNEQGRTCPLAALEALRLRIRTRHYSYKTECSDADWVRRFFAYLSERQQTPHPLVDTDSVRVDFDQGLLIVRSGKGDKDRTTLLADMCREPLRVQLRAAEAIHQKNRQAGLPGVWLPDALDRKLDVLHSGGH
jgi:hypothetical protein